MHQRKGQPKFRATPRRVTDEDISAAIKLSQKWGAALTVTRDGQKIVQPNR